jgi:hypothetical protein
MPSVLSGLEMLVDVNLALATESQRGYSKVYGACLDELGVWGTLEAWVV